MRYTHADLAAAITERLSPTYTLVYIDRDDKLTDTQVAALVRADFEALNESIWEWHSDLQYDAAREIINDLQRDVITEWFADLDRDADDYERDYGLISICDDDFEFADAWQEVRFAITDRDTSDVIADLAGATPDVLMRVAVPTLGEDAGLSYTDVAPTTVLDALGFAHTDANVEAVAATLAETSPEFSVVMGYLVFGADVSHLLALAGEDDALVAITDPHIYLGNPFAGSGWLSEDALAGTFTIKRSDLLTDADAFGYSVAEVFGGLSASAYSASITTDQEVTA